MNAQNVIKTQTLLLSIVILFISWIVGYIFLTNKFTNSLDSQFKTITSTAYDILDEEIQREKKDLKYKINEILEQDGFKQAILVKDYKSIDLIASKYYAKFSYLDKYIQNIIVLSSDNKLLFTADKKQNIDKNILKINKSKKSLDGFEVLNSAVSYKVSQPVFLNNKFIGSIEITINSKKIIQHLNLLLSIQTAIVLDNKVINKDTLIDSSDILKYYFEFKNSPNFEFLNIDIQKNLLNYSKETVAYLIIASDLSEIGNKNKEFVIKIFFTGLIATILITLIVYIGFTILVKYTTRQTFIDKLTGLNNRDSLNNDLVIDDSNIFIVSNIKEFSLLNQYYGLEIANEVLKQVATGFKTFANEHNMRVYRISADEYVLLSNDNRLGVIECGDILEELNDTIGSMEIKVGHEDETLKIEIYSGVSFNGVHPLEEAQIALREAKAKALPYLAYAQNLDNKVDTKNILDIKKIIKHAIEHKNIIPFFQPITNQYGEFIKYEALVRILDFENGNEKILYPDQFLSIAIRSGLYVDLAKEMLSQALIFFKDREEKISVNFLPNDFYNHEIMDRFIGLVQMYKKPERIVVEITEQEGVGDFDRLFKIVKKLRKVGVTIAIDDFGSGYANYVHILQLKPDYLKIDGSLIKNILTDADSQILVKSITRFAGYMKIKTIAEYVENEDIFELLKTYGVDEFQGYYFGRPLNLISGPNIF